MKKYLLMRAHPWETSGGFDDFEGSFNTVEEAKTAFIPHGDDAQIAIIDGEEFKVICEYSCWGNDKNNSWRERMTR